MMEEMKLRLRRSILDSFDYSETVSDEALLRVIDSTILKEARVNFLSLEDKERLRSELYNSIRGLDIIEELLADNNITEVMINGTKAIFYEKDGKLYKWDRSFDSGERLADIVQKIAAGANRTVNEANPIVDARLGDGSRVNIVLPPVAIDGPIVTIRKFSKNPYVMADFISFGSISEEAADYLRMLVEAKYNIFVCGGTGSGKTTFLNALSDFIPKGERIITIEDSAELKITGTENLVRLEVRNKNVEEVKEVTIRDLIRTALRMRPDRIIVGEVRGKEAIDMLSAMNTGHDGSLSTGHANTVSDMLDRLETMVLLGSDIPLLAARKQISSAIEIMVHLGRLKDGSRHVLEIAEITGLSDGEIEKNTLFKYVEDEDGKGRLIRTESSQVRTRKLVAAGFGGVLEKKAFAGRHHIA